MKKKYMALFLFAALAFTAVPAMNPAADATLVAEAHGGRRNGGHHGCGGHRRSYQTETRDTGHYHCDGYGAHYHEDGVCPYNTADRCYDDWSACYDSCDWNQ